MKPRFSIAALAALAAAVALSGCAAPGTSAPGAGGPGLSHMPAPTSMSMQSHAGMESMIHIDAQGVSSPIPLAPGAEVTVMNMDTKEHTVASDDGSSFEVAVPAGGLATFKAPAQPGDYPFHSGTAAALHGVLTVAAAPGAAPAAAAKPAPAATATPPAAKAAAAKAPSEAAKMVCADEAKATVKTITGAAAVPEEGWDGTAYSCRYPLAKGDFIMTVTEAADSTGAQAFARDLAASVQAAPIEGLANLGLPGYRSTDGQVVFAKDNMTLQVDATGLSGPVGPENISPADFAYQMATTILGCWTAHH